MASLRAEIKARDRKIGALVTREAMLNAHVLRRNEVIIQQRAAYYRCAGLRVWQECVARQAQKGG